MRSTRNVSQLTALILAMTFTTGCGDTGNDSVASSTPSTPTWEEFQAQTRRVVDGREVYVVEWDLGLTKAELRAYYDRNVAKTPGVEPESTVNRVGSQDDVWRNGDQLRITYCVTNDFGAAKARAVSEMSQATAAWQRETNVVFTYLPAHDSNCSNANSQVTFAVRPWTSGGACAFFPSGGGCVPRTLVINFSDLDNNYRTKAPNVTTIGVFRHELGHILGLRHEQARVATTCKAENTSWRALTAYDQQSVMHYPWCNGVTTSDLSITPRDSNGVRQLYGQRNSSFSGDVRADLMFFEPADATLNVSTSVGNAFGGPGSGRWAASNSFGSIAANYYPGDFNGDGLVDLGYFEPANNSFFVSISTGRSLSGAGTGRWVAPNTFGSGAGNYYVADFNGDGRDDLMFFEPANLTVNISLSTGSGFGGPNSGQWLSPSSFGSVGASYLTGDFNGDGTSDLAYIERGDNSVHVQLSTGTGFGGAGSGRWIAPGSFGHSAGRYYAADFTGDKRADLMFFEPSNNSIFVSTSSGVGFGGAGSGMWVSPNGFGSRMNFYFPGDFDGDGVGDLGYLESNDAFYVSTSTRTSFGGPGTARWVSPGSFGGNWGTYFVGHKR